MVEVHLIRLEATAAILAWHLAQLPKHLDGAGLADANAVYLHVAIAPVVGDIRGSLVPNSRRHREV